MQARDRAELEFSGPVSAGVIVSENRTVLSYAAGGWGSAIMAPAISASRQYVEIEILGIYADMICACVTLGVTSESSCSEKMHQLPTSWMFDAITGRFLPGEKNWGASASLPTKVGDRMGALVDGGELWISVNGKWVGPGAMASGLPRQPEVMMLFTSVVRHPCPLCVQL